ncbi:maintenance of telomere capping protein 1 [Halteromyces radiatus]|uniref:maintenance of telomere capping protein 1 n=1 Tax=Halteromyces radiatus TaxID=101107 RepID=UPI00221ED7D8|nr:maintenance of telomere capping protein 1 [Halteromyces radiatus]KAI8096237.1 maintenance of telomere capping protein 1 [Halteromyces radiatus]
MSAKEDQHTSNSLSEAEKFLESLNLPDSSSDPSSAAQPSATTASTTTTTADRSDIMNFLDEISNYPTEQQQQQQQQQQQEKQKQQEEQATGNSYATKDQTLKTQASTSTTQAENTSGSWMSWGNSLLAQASAAVKTTTDQINRTVQSTESKHLLEDRVKHLQTLVNKDTIEKLGSNLRQLTTQILETVAPPISEHELVEIWLSHDMVGYSGVEALVYRAFARVMEQTESGQVIVRKGMDNSHDNDDEAPRDLNMCEGVVEGTKLAKASVDHLIKLHYTRPEPTTTYTPKEGAVPVINCPVFMVIQPVKSSFSNDKSIPSQLVYAVVLEDPTNQLSFQTYSQSIPLAWLDIPYEENEWVEDKMVDVLRMAVTTVAQDYVWTRMTGGKKLAQVVKETSELQDQQGQMEQQSPATETKTD